MNISWEGSDGGGYSLLKGIIFEITCKDCRASRRTLVWTANNFGMTNTMHFLHTIVEISPQHQIILWPKTWK
jgi:hypothetical protein